MTDFFKLSAVSKKRYLELVDEKSDIYDSPEVYGLNYQEKILEGNGSSAWYTYFVTYGVDRNIEGAVS